MEELVIATQNVGKLREIELCLQDLRLLLRPMTQFPGLHPQTEGGNSFEENAVRKAHYVARQLGKPALADDSGLEVVALDGRPGVFSARFAGPQATDADNNRRLLQELKDVPRQNRQARFVCVMAVVHPEGRELIAKGVCEGEILEAARGYGGFGYDPLFFYPPSGKSFAELIPPEKARVSHRGQCLQQLRAKLPNFLGL